MSFLLALIFYNASLQINIVPQCKDWSIFCFDLADDLVPCKAKSAKIRLENDGLLISVDHSWSLDQSSIVFKHARCKNGQQWCSNYRPGRKANRSNRFDYWAVQLKINNFSAWSAFQHDRCVCFPLHMWQKLCVVSVSLFLAIHFYRNDIWWAWRSFSVKRPVSPTNGFTGKKQEGSEPWPEHKWKTCCLDFGCACGQNDSSVCHKKSRYSNLEIV